MDGYGYSDGRRALILAPLTLGHDGSATFSGKVIVNPNTDTRSAGLDIGGLGTLKQYAVNLGGGIVSQQVYLGFDTTPLGETNGVVLLQDESGDYVARFNLDKVEVGGTLTAAGIFDSTVVSARRYKDAIRDFAYDPDALMALRPREWVYSEEAPKSRVGKYGAGFVADEVPLIFAEENGEGYKQDRIVAQLVSGWKDNRSEIAALRARIAALEARDG